MTFRGGQIGFNYQFLTNWVAGIEADIDAAHITSSTFACFTGATTTVCGTRDTDVKDFGTVRGRLGYAFNNVLLYGMGGWAWGHGNNTTQITCVGPGCPGTSVLPTSPAPASVDVEADIDAAHITSSTSACFTGFGTGVCGIRDTDVKDFGTVRGRLGYAFNNVLVYGTGGWAWGHGTNTIQFTCLGPQCPGTSGLPPTSPIPTSVDVNPTGWAAGGGVEWAFLPNWTLRAEYLHLQFDRITEDRSKSSSFIPSLLVTSHVSSNTGIDVVRFGVNYLFNSGNGKAPVVARY